MNVLQVSAEIFPLIKTGGLADVAGALPTALNAAGCDTRVLLPGFVPIMADLHDSTVLAELVAPWGEPFVLCLGRLASLNLMAYVIDLPLSYHRPGSPYEDLQHRPFADNYRRFALLGWVASRLAGGLDLRWQPQVVHSHDWHAALASAYMAFLPAQRIRVASVYTVHNLAYDCLFAARHFFELALPSSAFSVDGLEFHGQMSFMKAGLFFSDHITTVSPNYALEIQTQEQGYGMDGLLRLRADELTGVLNGVDETVWNPAQDPAILHPFDADQPAGKLRCKAGLQHRLGLTVQNDAPLFGIVSRITEQKGLHLVLKVLDQLLARGGQLVMMGEGDLEMELAFRQRAAANPLAVSVHIGYDENFAHQIFAATDVTLVPSSFEPCGLTQMYGLKYGSLPLVHHVGGLVDTVVDCSLEDMANETANGFVFHRFDAQGLLRAIRRAFALYARPTDWQVVRTRAMKQPMGWDKAAVQYVELYRKLCT